MSIGGDDLIMSIQENDPRLLQFYFTYIHKESGILRHTFTRAIEGCATRVLEYLITLEDIVNITLPENALSLGCDDVIPFIVKLFELKGESIDAYLRENLRTPTSIRLYLKRNGA